MDIAGPDMVASYVDVPGPSAWAHDEHLEGEVARSVSLRALTGEAVTITSADDLKLVTWSASMRFVLDGKEYGFQALRSGLLDTLGSLVSFVGSIEVNGGTLSLVEIPEERTEEEVRAIRALNGATGSPWVGVWSSEGRFDLVLFGSDVSRAEEQAVDQLMAFSLTEGPQGIIASPASSGRRLSVYGSQVSAHLPPLGSLDLYSRVEGAYLVPPGPSAPTAHGEVHRVVIDMAHESFERFVVTTQTAVAVIYDPRFPDLDQVDRLRAVESLDVSWR
jgi:hypothetical protein